MPAAPARLLLHSACAPLHTAPSFLQGLPFGHLGSLWSVLLAWGAPAACSGGALVLPLAAPVCYALELCSGDTKPTAFDEAVLERLADSLLTPPQQHAAALAANPATASLAQLREFVLCTFVRRYLGRSHVPHDSAQRCSVNAVRLLEVWGQGWLVAESRRVWPAFWEGPCGDPVYDAACPCPRPRRRCWSRCTALRWRSTRCCPCCGRWWMCCSHMACRRSRR